VQDDRNPGAGDLMRGFRSGETGSNDVNGG